MTVATTPREVPKDVIRLALRHLWTTHPDAPSMPRQEVEKAVQFEFDDAKWFVFCLICPEKGR